MARGRRWWVPAAVAVLAAVMPVGRVGAYNTVVSLGANLTAAQQRRLMAEMGVEAGARRLLVTNRQEHQVLAGIAPPGAIGTRAISSAYVVLGGTGTGIRVSTHNITWVTPGMYRNALATAGVRDAAVTVAAPFPVSGTAALVGVLWAYHAATGAAVSYHQERVAARELVVTGQVGHAVDHPGTLVTLMADVKASVVRDRLASRAAIRRRVAETASRLDVRLSPAQEGEIVSVMVAIAGLHLNAATLDAQVHGPRREGAAWAALWQTILHGVHWLWTQLMGVARAVTGPLTRPSYTL